MRALELDGIDAIEIAVLDDALKGYEDDIAKLQKKLSEARARQSNVSTRLESAENRCQVSWRIGGMTAPSGTSTAKRNSSATGASSAISTNSGKLHGFISASGKYSGSSTVPYWVRL